MFEIWNENNERLLKDLGLNCDVLLLSDVFENFRNSSFKSYGLLL